MQPTLADIQAARASARQRRDTAAKRLKRLILKLVTRIEAFEHELSLLTKVERDVIANGTTAELFPRRTETRFDGGVPKTAVVTPENAQEASSAVRRASPTPSSEASQPELSPGGPPPANHPSNTALVDELTRSYAAGDGF
jgi:hypothetical protein